MRGRFSDFRRGLPMIAGQFGDGFGARYHGLLLVLYATQVAGLAGFSGFTAAGLVGSVLAALITAPLSTRLSVRGLLVTAAALLTAARLVSYVLLLAGSGLAPLLVLRLLGAVCGTILMNAAKSQAILGDDRGADDRADDRAAGHVDAGYLAWMSSANGVGGALGAVAAGGVTVWAPMWLLVATGATVAAVATLPLVRAAWRAAPVQLPAVKITRDEYRRVGPAAGLGALVALCTSGVALLRDGITVELYSAEWVGAVNVVALVGAMVAGPVLRRVQGRIGLSDTVLWPLLGVGGLLGWAIADQGVVWLIAVQLASGFFAQSLGALEEARIIGLSGAARSVPTLTAAGAVASLASAAAVLATPVLLSGLGYAATAVLCALPLAGVALLGVFVPGVRAGYAVAAVRPDAVARA